MILPRSLMVSPLLLSALLLGGCGPTDKADDTGDSGETGDSGDSGDSGETDETGDSGDTTATDSDSDGYTDDVDCADADPNIHPDATELCNGLDDDCDSLVDSADPGLADGTTFFVDGDGDGYGGSDTLQACAPAEGLVDTSTDCDDTDAAVHPDAGESCNGYDDDCDDVIDEADPDLTVRPLWYDDQDGDGYGDPDDREAACEAPAGFVDNGDDCNDRDDEVNPAAEEVCDGDDNDCDGLVDDADDSVIGDLLYEDADGDGHGVPDTSRMGCDDGSGWALVDDDCDDTDRATYPGATETCDAEDDDCDGSVDEGIPTSTWYADGDRDGYGDATDGVVSCGSTDGRVATGTDCDDGDASTNPGASERCDGVDDDCDSVVDDNAIDATTWYLDADGDTYGLSSSSVRTCDGPDGYADAGGDCNDADADVYPGASDDPGDGVDANCDGENDYDGDSDGYVLDEWASASGLPGGDCDDADASVSPGALESCNDADDDCDGEIDEGSPADAPTWYADADADGYGDPAVTMVACDQPDAFVDNGDDCDDADAAMLDVGCEGGYGGHRIDKDGNYYYALYNDRGFGILGSRDWYGSSDPSSTPEGVAWSPDQTILYYNDLAGNVFAQTEPFGATSTLIGSFGLGQVGGGVVTDTHYYVGDYSGGNIYAMDLSTGRTSLYSSLGSACKPYFGNSAMSIDDDGALYAASSCGLVRYEPGGSATNLAAYSNLISAVAMDADQNLYGMDNSGYLIYFDKTSGSALRRVRMAVSPSTTWTMAFDGNGNFVVNYWGEQRIFNPADGRVITTYSASTYYPGSSGYYWYVTF